MKKYHLKWNMYNKKYIFIEHDNNKNLFTNEIALEIIFNSVCVSNLKIKKT